MSSRLSPILALLLLWPSTSSAYLVMKYGNTELHWTSLPMKWNVHNGAAQGLTVAAAQAAVRAAYKTWSTVSCSAFTSQDVGVVNLPWGDQGDHVNTHTWTPSWPSNYEPSALGITWTQYDPVAGKILDADTHYNPKVPWAVSGSPYAIDAQAVATHEIGHQLGLDHSTVQQSTMFYATGAGDTSQRSLDADDIAGLCHLYPSGMPLPPECSIPEHCSPSETCSGGKCVANVQKGYGSPCNSPKECKSTICLQYGSYTFCSQACDATTCPSGDKCLTLSDGSGKACLPGSASQGTKLLGQTCKTSEDCKSGICASVPGQGYLCSQKCDLALKNCPAGFICMPASGGGGLCAPGSISPPPPPPPAKKKLGESCAEAGECESGLCTDEGAGKVCSKPCEPACQAGFHCVGGSCVEDDPGQPPPPPPGGGELGEACEKNDDCKSKLCADDGEGWLFCTETCDPEEGCSGELDCLEVGEDQLCMPRAETPAKTGCAVGDGAGAGPRAGLVLLGLVLIALLAAARGQQKRSR